MLQKYIEWNKEIPEATKTIEEAERNNQSKDEEFMLDPEESIQLVSNKVEGYEKDRATKDEVTTILKM